jgi:hypothetical protein
MDALKTIAEFIDRINHGDVKGIIALLADNHTFIDAEGVIKNNFQHIVKDWEDYINTYVHYRIYIRQIFELEESVAIVGHTTGSHLALSDEVEFHSEGAIWLVKVAQEKITHWQIFSDSIENIKTLRLHECAERYLPSFMAATIAKHLDLLPGGSRMRDVRNVRSYYSHLYRNAPPEIILSIGEYLIFDQGYRLVPYELIYYHPGTIELLNPSKITALGKGINDWSSSDMFAHYIAGPTWLSDIITDDLIDTWISSPNKWWRRAALVSSIYLHGDIDRMLKYCQLLIGDQEETIIKAISWVLREAIRYDRKAVIEFLDKNKNQLAPRIKFEVGVKLETMMKTS